jgi:adenylate cyclase
MSATRQLAAILFADIAGYTALMQQDEKKALEMINRFKELIESVTPEFQGRIIQYFGDGCLLAFDSSVKSVECALALQKSFRESPVLPVRIGLHLGDVLFKNGNAFGDGVNIASRIESLSVPGAVLVSKSIRDQVKNKVDFKLISLGQFDFKNVEDRIEVFALANDDLVIPRRNKLQGKLKTKNQIKKFSILIVSSLLLLTALFFIYKYFYGNNSADDSDRSIAVLPFADLSSAKDQEYFSDGLSEDLINLLSKVPGLKVIGRTSSFSFKGKNDDLREIGEKLNVAHILEGSVRKDLNKIRITTRLIKTKDGSQVWNKQYDRDLEGLFKLQDEIALAVVNELKLKLLPDRSTVEYSSNIEVHNLILQGNYFFDKLDEENVAKALDFYTRARDIDSNDARVWAVLAKTYSRQAWQNYIDQYSGYELARQAALRSIKLNDKLFEGHLQLAIIKMYHDFDWEGAAEGLAMVENLAPPQPTILNNLGVLAQIRGEWNKAIDYVNRAIELDPLRPIFYSNQGANLTYANRFNEAISFYKKALEVNPQFQRAHMYIARIYLLQGKTKLALEELNLEPIPIFKEYGLALAYHASGMKKQADETFAKFINTYQNEWAYLIAEIYAFRGEKDKAFEWLNIALSRKDSWLVWLKDDPLLKNLENDIRHKEFLKKMNLD